MPAWEIKRHLSFGAMTEIGKQLGVGKSAVSRVISGTMTSRRIQVAVARRLGRKVCDVFPVQKDSAT